MLKAMVLDGHPENLKAFDHCFVETNLPIALKVPGMIKLERSSFLPDADGTIPAYHLMAELYFNGPAELQATPGSPGGQAAANGLANFASGGVTMLVGILAE